jgi:hypothetical protein
MSAVDYIDPLIPAELGGLSPRMVRLRPGGARGLARLVIAAMVAPILLLSCTAILLFLLFAPIRLASITYLHAEHRHHRGDLVGYTYVIDDTPIEHWESVNDNVYGALKIGQSVQVHVATIGPWSYSELSVEADDTKPERWFLWILALIASIGLVLSWRRDWLIPRRQIRNGIAVRAELTGVRKISRQTDTVYRIAYCFYPHGAEALNQEVTYWVRKRQIPEIGQNITILYDPINPAHNLIYELSNFVAT